MKDYFGVDEQEAFIDYLTLRYLLDQDYADAIIIISLYGDTYVDVDNKEYKL
jgi:hypothetical protein